MEFKPYPYQQYCIDSIIYNRSMGLFLDMGLGKTVITLTAVQPVGGGKAPHHRPQEGGGGYVVGGGQEMGPSEDDADCPGPGDASAKAARSILGLDIYTYIWHNGWSINRRCGLCLTRVRSTS